MTQIEEQELKKFRLTWTERVCSDEGDFLHLENKETFIMAKSADEACDQWESDNEYNEYQNGLNDCVEVVESPLFEKMVFVDMPDGLSYGLKVEIIARDRADRFAQDFDNNKTKSLMEGTLPLFTQDETEIFKWATTEMKWEVVKSLAYAFTPKLDAEALQVAWQNATPRLM